MRAYPQTGGLLFCRAPGMNRYNRRSIRLKGYDYSQVGAYFVTICTQGKACLFGDVTDGAIQLNNAGNLIDATWRDIPSKYPGVDIDAFVIMPNHFHGIIVISHVGERTAACPTGADQTRPPEEASTARVLGDPVVPIMVEPDASEDATNPQANNIHDITVIPGITVIPDVGAGPRACPTTADPNRLEARTPNDRGAADEFPPMLDESSAPLIAGYAHPTSSAAPVGQAQGPAPTILSLSDVVQRFKSFTTRRYADHVEKDGWAPFPGRLWQRNYYEHVIRDEDALERIREYIANNPGRWEEDSLFPRDDAGGQNRCIFSIKGGWRCGLTRWAEVV